jgi:uncharacterized protein (DUF2062 family)
MNPLYKEYKRSRLYTLAFILALAMAAAMVDYFLALNQRIVQRQQLLLSAAEDLEHQLTPVAHLLKVLKQEAEASLLQDTSEVAEPEGQQWSLVTAEPNQQLSDDEKRLLTALLPQLKSIQKTSTIVRQFSYLSASGIWYVPVAQRSAALELEAQLFWQQKQQQHKLNQSELRLHRIKAADTAFMLSVGIGRGNQMLGELVLNLDLATMLQLVAKAQQDSTLQLLNDIGEPILAIAQGQVLTETQTEALHHSDSLRTLTILPLTLHLEAANSRSVIAELGDLVGHFLLYLLTLLLLWWYCRRRFRTKVLAPFQRLLVHVERLERGDPHGVRHVPNDWLEVFQQVEQLRLKGNPDQNIR